MTDEPTRESRLDDELEVVREEVADVMTAVAMLTALLDSGWEQLDDGRRSALLASLHQRTRYLVETLMPRVNEVVDRMQLMLSRSQGDP